MVTTEEKAAMFDRIVAMRKTYIDAVDAYNARLEVVQAERKRGNWLNVDPEYASSTAAQRDFWRGVQEITDAVIAAPETPKDTNGHVWHDRVFASMKLCVCMNCGFVLNEDKPNGPCPGPVCVDVRTDSTR